VLLTPKNNNRYTTSVLADLAARCARHAQHGSSVLQHTRPPASQRACVTGSGQRPAICANLRGRCCAAGGSTSMPSGPCPACCPPACCCCAAGLDSGWHARPLPPLRWDRAELLPRQLHTHAWACGLQYKWLHCVVHLFGLQHRARQGRAVRARHVEGEWPGVTQRGRA
jgi:hypothetical protein